MTDIQNNPQTTPAEPSICLDQFLKTCGVPTGGQAKLKIQTGEVMVNGLVETRRRRKLRVGDEVTFDNTIYVVDAGGDEVNDSADSS